MTQRRPREKSEAHRKFIATLPCLVCGDDTSTECAHIRFPDLKAGKRHSGIGEKSDDSYTVPLCGVCHRKQHKSSERGFWELYEIDPVKVALALWKWSGDHAMGVSIVLANRPAQAA